MSKWRNYGLWISLASAVILAVQAFGSIFGYQIAPEKYDEIMTAFNALLGVLVVLGIVSNPEVGKGFTDKKD
ncbi:phage holin [Paenibacillus vini]|uniref:phage holin n=1 Tax=Paenibacillus vini TaxID=1476024 RepID=UPI0025B688BC|nr:phage holin [Paenibacillus vini]MDN4069924.1 phage holin [Paenibacillus vini]